MVDRVLGGSRFLTEQDVKIITEGEGFIAEQLLVAETQLALRRAKGSVALFADYLGLSENTGNELVDVVRKRLEGLSKEEAEELIGQFSSLIAKIPELPVSETTDALSAPVVPTAEIAASAQNPDISDVATLAESEPVAPRTPVKSRQAATAANVPAQAEVVSGPASLDEATIIYFESLVGPFDTSKLTTADAQRLTDFFLGKRRDVRKNSTNDKYHEQVLRDRLSNVTRGDIAIRIGRKPQDVSNILVGLRTMIHAHYSIEQLAELLKKELSSDLNAEPQVDQVVEQAVDADLTPLGVEVTEIVAPESEAQVDVAVTAKSVSAVPAPPSTKLVYATQKPAVEKASEPRTEKKTEAYSDVVVGLAKTLELDEQDTYFLSLLLDEHIETQSKISYAQKTRIVKIVRDAVYEKFTSLFNPELGLSQGEKVALNNILGILYRNNKPDFQPGQTVSEYIHKDGAGKIDYDRQRFSADGLEKLANAFAKPLKGSSLYT